jgi:predicted GIY-YIG superfamily endonuclease
MKRSANLLTITESASAWVVYILRCADGSLYTGITNDLWKRLEKHNAGTASRYTRCRLPVILVYQEASANRSSATKRELTIKALKKSVKEALIQSVKCNKLPDN